jgi:hypothetical protein
MAAHWVLQYLPLAVVQEQTGCAHLLAFEVSIVILLIFRGASLPVYRKMAILVPAFLPISEIDPYV